MSNDPDPQYQDRIVVFLDFLGWTELIENAKDVPQILVSLDEKLDQAAHEQDLIRQARSHGNAIPHGPQVAHFSDTIVISRLSNDPSIIDTAFTDTIYRVAHFLKPFIYHRGNPLLKSGLLCRGAIVRGKLFHRDNMVVGPALIAAHKMENTLAVYPRILIAEDLVTEHKKLPERKAFVQCDSDGLWFLDIFSYFLHYLDGGDNAPEYARIWFEDFRKSIDNGLRLYGGDPKKLMKWTWIANQFNEAIRGRDGIGVKPIELPTERGGHEQP